MSAIDRNDPNDPRNYWPVGSVAAWESHAARATRRLELDGLKVTAFAFMIFDHLASFTGRGDWWRVPGRAALPLFALGLGEKFAASDHQARIVWRLLAWACVAQVPCYLAGWSTLNILFTLAFGLACAAGESGAIARGLTAAVLVGLASAEWDTGLKLVEYGGAGVLLVTACVYAASVSRLWWLVAIVAVYLCQGGDAVMGSAACLALVAGIACVDAEGCWAWVQRVPGWCWYALYPAHIAALWALVESGVI